MGGGLSKLAKQEVLATIRDRYRECSIKDKGRIRDEFIAVTGHHRKHGIRLLGQLGSGEDAPRPARDWRIYDEAVREAVIVIWEAADRICGKRLRAALPHLVESMERHGHLDPEVRTRLLIASAATLDRLLKPIRPTAGSRRRRRRRQSMSNRVPVRTYNDWDRPPPDFLEIDLVAHCGGPLFGSFIHSLVAADVCTGWTEAVPLLAKEQSLVVAGLEAVGQRLPFPVLGIDSDNDSVFFNETLVQYCAGRGIEFTRSRAYRSNDQAWIEQKNGSVVRRFVGHDRYSGQVAGQTMAYLYEALRLYVNFLQPSFKLIDKTRDGSTTVKRYSQPATPCDRLIQHDAAGAELKALLNENRPGLDPVLLLHTIREAQSALVAATSPGVRETPDGESLERFLAKLPSLWRQGEVRPTHVAVAVAGQGDSPLPDQALQEHQVAAGVLAGAEYRLGHGSGGIVHGDEQRQLRSPFLQPRVLAAVDLYQHSLLGHTPAPETVLRRAATVGTADAGFDQDESHRGTAQVDALAFPQQFGEVGVVCPRIAVAGQPYYRSRSSVMDGIAGPTASVPVSQCGGTVFAVGREETLGMTFAYSHNLGSLGDGKVVFQNAVEHLNPCLFLLIQRYIPHRDDIFAEQIAGDRIVDHQYEGSRLMHLLHGTVGRLQRLQEMPQNFRRQREEGSLNANTGTRTKPA